MELRRSCWRVVHRACAEVAGKTERRSAGRGGEDCGAEQGGGTERQNPNAIGRGSREVVVHGITFEVDCAIRSCPLVISPGRPVRRSSSRLHGGYERYRPLTALRGLGPRRFSKGSCATRETRPRRWLLAMSGDGAGALVPASPARDGVRGQCGAGGVRFRSG